MLAAASVFASFADTVRESTITGEACARPEPGATITVPWFDGATISVTLGERTVSSCGIVTFSGRTAAAAYGNATVTMTANGFIVNTVDAATGNAIAVRRAGDVWHLRESTRRVSHAKCGNTTSSSSRHAARSVVSGGATVDGAGFLKRGEIVTNVIDVLVALDKSAANWVRGKSDFAGMDNAVEYFAATALAQCNNTYANTDLNNFFTFNLAGVIEVDYDCSQLRDDYGDVNSEQILVTLGEPNDSQALKSPAELKTVAASVRTKRDECAADVVSFLVACGSDSPSGTVGIGYSLDNDTIRNAEYMSDVAYNVCLIETVADSNTMAHEIGHNLGAGHAEMKEKDNSGPQLYSYSTGYYFNVTNAEGNVFMHAASVMAYDSDGYDDDYEYRERWGEAPDYADDTYNWNYGLFTETYFFSSSKHTFKYVDEDGKSVDSGILLGDATHDNTRILSETYPLAANYRVRPISFDQDGAYFELVCNTQADPIALTIASNVVDGITISLSGLPAGLKFDASTWLITGTPTKAGEYSVKATIKYASGTQTITRGFAIAVKNYELTVVAGEGGTVKGGGEYAANKTVKLIAKANSGYVFAGWYTDAAMTEPAVGTVDYRTATFPIVTGNGNRVFYARFVPTAADALSLDFYEEYVTDKDGSFPLDLAIESLSLPKLKLKGLPTGLKFDSKTNTITGNATKPGVYTVTVSATNSSVKNAVTASFRLTVPNLQSAALPMLNPDTDAYSLSTGVAVDSSFLDLTLAGGYTISAVSGLPTGVKCNKTTGTFTGVPTKAGTYTVTVTAKSGKTTATATVTVTVSALPTWVAGTFQGLVSDEAGEGVGIADLTITAAGRISGKLQLAGTKWTLSAKSFASADEDCCTAVCQVKNGKNVKTLTFTLNADGITGNTNDGLSLAALRNVWKDKSALADLKSTYQKVLADYRLENPSARLLTATVLDGITYLGDEPTPITLTLANSGTIKATAKYITGYDAKGKATTYSASATATLLDASFTDKAITGEVVLYFAPKKGKFPGFVQCFPVTFGSAQ